MKKVKCHLLDNWVIIAFCKYMPLQGILRTWDSDEYMIKVDLFHFVFSTAVAVIMCLHLFPSFCYIHNLEAEFHK